MIRKPVGIQLIGNDISQGIGDTRDEVGIPYVEGNNSIFSHLNTMYHHVHGEAFIYPDKADPVLLTSAASEWAETGAITEVIPPAGTSKPFDLHWISISDIDDTGYFVVDIYAGSAGEEVRIGEIDGWRTSNFIAEGSRRVQIPQQSAGTRISCKLSNSTNQVLTVKVKFQGHYYG